MNPFGVLIHAIVFGIAYLTLGLLPALVILLIFTLIVHAAPRL